MKFIIPFIGKTREKYLDQGIADYHNRLQRYLPVEIRTVREKHSRNDPDQIIMAREAELLLSQCPRPSFLVALDPGGRQQSSEEMARSLENWENQGLQNVVFLIGGYLGLDPSIPGRADLTWSLSRLTFTHEMTRFILLEQLYRACSIKAGHNYHK